MKEIFACVFGFLVLIGVVTGISLYSASFGLYMKRTFGVAYEDADRKIFEASQGYNQGMIRDLENLELQYHQANESQKLALRATIIHRFSGYDVDKLPPHLRNFYSEIRGM